MHTFFEIIPSDIIKVLILFLDVYHLPFLASVEPFKKYSGSKRGEREDEMMASYAVRGGYFSLFCQHIKEKRALGPDIMDDAVVGGCPEILEWLYTRRVWYHEKRIKTLADKVADRSVPLAERIRLSKKLTEVLGVTYPFKGKRLVRLSIASGNLSSLRWLISKGYDLPSVVRTRNVEMLKFLIERGCRISGDVKDPSSQSLLPSWFCLG